MGENAKYVASFSGGKDSLAMVLWLIENKKPLDYVVFYDTGMEFSAIYRNVERVKELCKSNGIVFIWLTPKTSFLYDMFERPVQHKDGSVGYGYSWCGGTCRWGTTAKNKSISDFKKNLSGKVFDYVGIALDEPHRFNTNEYPGRILPLAHEAKMTEADCLKFCRDRGFHWREATTATESGFVDLYDILDRVSCWCCANKNLKELRNIYTYLPVYWERLKHMQSRTDRPMKKYRNKKYGTYGNVFELDRIFSEESKNLSGKEGRVKR